MTIESPQQLYPRTPAAHLPWILGLLVLVSLATLSTAPAAAQGPLDCENLLINGGFEDTPSMIANPGHEHYSDMGGQDVPGWDLEDGEEIEIQRNLRGSAAEEGGSHWLELAADEPATISQTVSLIPGALYEIRFAYSDRPGFGADNRFVLKWEQIERRYQARAVANVSWSYDSFIVEGPINGVGKITFMDESGDVQGAAMLIDDVSICRVPGVARSCCCGANEIYPETPYPHLNWALKENGNLARLWWDGGGHQVEVAHPRFPQPIVSGSLQRDPFGDGVVALTSRGNVVRAVEREGEWSTELVAPALVQRLGGVRPCALVTTIQGPFKGIWAVTENAILRLFLDEITDQWISRLVFIEDHAARIVPSSLHEIGFGRIAGVLDDGQRWNVWFENSDPNEMRFDFSIGTDIEVPPSPECGAIAD